MSKEENTEEFENFLNKKEEAGGAFENEEKVEDAEVVDPIEDTINKKGLGSVDMSKFKQQKADTPDTVLGYHSVDLDTLFSRGRFYPEGAKLAIRSAKVAEIRHFSTMNEANILDIEDKLNNIVKTCTRFTTATKTLSYKDIYHI